MPVIPFSSASRVVEVDRAAQEQRDIEEARRYREKSDAKLKELMEQKVKPFDPNGGTSPIDVPEPVTGGWRVRTNDDPQRNGDALPGGVFNRLGAPDINDPMRDEQGFGGPDNWTPELAMPAAPEGESFVGMGSGGPEQEVDPDIAAILEARIAKQKDRASLDLRSSLMQSTATPDQAAADLETAGKVGASRFEVEQNRKDFDIATLAKEIDKLSTDAPRSYEWLMAHTDNLEIAKDDVQNLGWWEQTAAFFSPGNLSIDKVGQALQSGFVDKIPEQLYGLDQMLGDANASIYKALPDWFPGKFGLVNEQVQRSLMADMKRQEMAAQGKANAPVGETWLERGIYGAAQSAPSTLVSLAITAVTKSPLVGSGSMGATTAGGAYGEARDEGKSLGDAFRYALTQGGIETATEFIPLKFLVDDLAKDSSFAKTFFRQAAAEGITEQAATFLQDASTFIELNPDKTLGEFLAERPNAALETLVASTIMSGVTTTVAKGVQAAGDQLDQNAKQKRAELLGKTFDAMAQNAKDSKLLKRLPEKYRELVNEVTKNGPLENVRIAPEAIVSLAQEKGVSVEQVAQAFRIDPNEMVTAMDAGEDVVIPAGNYAAGIAGAKKAIGVSGEEMHAAFAPNMRLRADDFTANEMAAMKSVMEAEQKARTEGGDAEQSFADAADRVRNTIREAVTATGLFNADAANTQAELVGSIVTTLAERTGQDPEALWKERGFDIVAALNGETSTPDSLPQSVTTDENAKEIRGALWNYESADPKDLAVFLGMKSSASPDEIRAEAARVYNEAKQIGLAEAKARQAAKLAETAKEIRSMRERGVDDRIIARNLGLEDGAMDRIVQSQDARDSLAQSLPDDATPTQRLIDMRAKGMGNAEIAAELYPDVDAKTATNRVKALASKHKAKIEERKAELEGAQSLDQAEPLEQTRRGDFTPREDRNVIRLFESANLSTLAHEGSHWYLDTLWRMSKTENPHPFVLEQLAAVLEWHGKSPNWDAMFNPDGSFTKEGVDLQEAFAESFEAYLMEGKAPTTALRSVFASFKQWLLSIYKGIAARIGGRARLNDEIRSVFDRMLATDEAIKAVHTGLARDGEAMAKAILDKQDPDGKWKPERREKFMERMRERYAAARERAEAALMARLMDEFQRTKQAAWRDEERQVKREVQSEVDARPEQRAYSWLTGIWRETDEDRLANEAADEAEAMRALAQEIRAYHGSRYSFDRFEISDQTIGTGEGTQSRGYGLYFADRQGLAEFYQNLDRVKSPEDFAGQVLAENGGNVGAARAYLKGEIRTLENTRTLRDFAKSYKDALKALDRGKATPADKLQRYLYEVNLTLTPGEDVLDLDIAIADQTPAVREKFAEAWASLSDEPLNMQATGFDLIQMDGRSKAMSEAMLAAGLKGVQFFDAASRARGDGSRNYVMFSADDIRIVAKNGEPVAEMTEPAGVLSMEDGAGSLAQTDWSESGYARVMPRDLFNEAKVLSMHLKLIEDFNAGRLPKGFSISVSGDDIDVRLTENGDLYLGNVEVSFNGTPVDVQIAYNAGKNVRFPMQVTAEDMDAWSVTVYDDNGTLDAEFVEAFGSETASPKSRVDASETWSDAKAFMNQLGVVGLWDVDGKLPRNFVFDLIEPERGFQITDEGGRIVSQNLAASIGEQDVQFYMGGDGVLMFESDDASGSVISGARAMSEEFKRLLSEYGSSTSLAQTVQPSRQLDAMGFYSAAQEAAQRVPDGIWQMGWQAARNSLAKGRDGIVPRKTEIEYLGLDAMFGDTKLKGAALKDAVLEHIAAKRLSLVENFARFDPNAVNDKLPPKRQMLEQMDDGDLASAIGLIVEPTGSGDGRISTDIGENSDLFLEKTDVRHRLYTLVRVKNGGGTEVVATGFMGDMQAAAARIIVNEHMEKALRRLTAEQIGDVWRDAQSDFSAKNLVRGPGDIRLPGEDVPLFEAVIGLPEGVPGSDYRAPVSHVGGKAKGTLVTAHGEERIDDKGQRTVFVGQVQSDMAQQAREDKAAEAVNAPVIKASGIVDRASAMDYLFTLSMGYTKEEYLAEWSAYSDAKMIDSARSKWAEKNNLDYSYTSSGAINLDAPLLSTSEWTNVAVRSMLYRAAREGFQSISFPTAETSEIIQGNDDAAQHYETNVKGALEKLAKQLGGEVRSGVVKYNGMRAEWENIPPETAEKVLASLWSRLPPAVRGTIRMNMPNMRKTEEEEFYVATASRPGNDDSGVGKDTYEWTFAREAKRNPLIAAYQIWVQGAMLYGRPGTFERLITAAGGPNGAISEALQEAVAEGEPASAYILDITPAMRAKIMSEGFPLFQTGDDKGRATPPPNLPPMRLNLQAVKEQYGEQALAEIPPDVAAYSAEANDVEAYVQIARDVRKTLNETPPKSLWKFLSTARNIGQGEGRISYRGIRDTDGELLKIIGEKKAARGLIADPTKDGKRSRSYDMQQAIEAAWEAGYFDGEDLPTPAQFLDTLRADIDGQAPRYRRDDIPTVSTIAGAERWKDWFDQNDMDITSDVATLRAKLATVLTGQGTSAIGPDEAAEVFNGVIGTNAFPTGFDLLKALKQGPLRDKLIRDLTEQRMIERNGDVFRDGTIMQEAEAYARNEVQHRQFEIELEALAEAAGKGTAGALAKQTAIENLRSKQVREVLNYTQWLTLERRWAEKAIKAAAKGDTAQAAEFARYRLINSYMYSEGKKLAEKIEKTRKHLLDYGKKAKQVRLFAAGKEYADQMNGLLDDYQFRNESKKGENKRKARSAWIQTQMAGIDPFAAYADPTKSAQEQQIAAAEAIERSTVLARLSDGVDAQNYKSITVEELLAVRDEADLIYKLATLKDRLIKDGERRKLSLAAEDIAAEIEANQPNDKGPEPLETDTPGERVKSSVQMYFAMHRTLQSLAHQFAGGKEGGVFWRYIVRPLNEAFGNLTTIRKQMGEDVAGLFGVYTTAEQERFYRDRRQFAGIGRSLTTQGRLAIALNWGNEKNRRRIMDAYGWDEAQVQEVLDSLDKRDWDWVQSVWDYMDTWFPEANRVHEAVHGAPMDKVEPIQVATRFGVYRGGYYPIKYDPRTSSKSGQRAMEADAKRQTGGIGTRSQPGFGKKRVEGKVTLPLRLSALDVITQHLDEVAKSIATEETLFDIGRILKQPAVEEAIISRHGRQIYNQVVNQIITAKFGMDGTSGLLAHLRNGATVVGLSWKVATASLQILGASNSIVRVGGPWVAAGYAKTAGGGVPLYTAARDAMRMSEFMRNRRQNQSPEMASLLDAMKTKWTPDFIARFIPRELRAMHNFMVRNGFALMSNVQFASVDVPTWWGAYFKAQHTGASEADAVAMADQAVVDAQGGGEIYQLAAMQSGAGVKYGALLRILTNFMSYMITTYNLGVQRVRNARTAGQIMALGFDMIILAAVPVAGKMALDLITKGVGEDDEPEEWAEKYAREQIAFLFGPFVGISQFAGSARGDDSYGYKGPAGLMFFDVMNQLGSAVAEGKIIDEEEGGLDKNFWRPANRALGIVLHYPASQVDASIRGAQAYFNGETDNPAAIFFGPPPAN